MFYSRLKKAIQDQNWFAVLLELVVVILGVVIGFQVTAWAGRQADLSTERSYLNQIVADLTMTEAIMENLNSQNAPSESSAARLFDSFRKTSHLPNDSILVLISQTVAISNVNPVLGTIEALINTGDLNLIRNDSLRMAIPSYLEMQKSMGDWQARVVDEMSEAMQELGHMVDLAHANAVEVQAGGLIEVPSPQVNTTNPLYSTTQPFPFSSTEFRRSIEAYNVVYRIHHWKIQARMMRVQFTESAGDLKRLIASELTG